MGISKFKVAKILIATFGIAAATPAALSIAASLASASGYNVTSGLDNQPQCDPGGPDDCPN